MLNAKSHCFSYQESNGTSNYGSPNNSTAHAKPHDSKSYSNTNSESYFKSYSPTNTIADFVL